MTSKQENRHRRRWSCVVLGAIVYANLGLQAHARHEVTRRRSSKRDLEAIVSASGTIQPKRSVNISAETPGKVVEPDVQRRRHRSRRASSLLQIDPRNLQTHGRQPRGQPRHARSQLEQTKRPGRERQGRAARRPRTPWRARTACARAGLIVASRTRTRPTNDVKIAETNLSVSRAVRQDAGDAHQAGRGEPRQRAVQT